MTSDVNKNAIDSGEFLVDSVIEEGSAARYSLLQDRLTALETALRHTMTAIHKTYHVGILNQHIESWEECGMSSCRNARRVLDEVWWKED